MLTGSQKIHISNFSPWQNVVGHEI